MQYYTKIEQSKKLLELGLNPETADMHYPDYYFDGNATGPCNTPYKEAIENLFHVYINPKTKRLLPCWSLGALLELIPNYQLQTQNKNIGILFSCRKEFKIIEASTPTEAAYNMVCWLLENKYIKKGRE